MATKNAIEKLSLTKKSVSGTDAAAKAQPASAYPGSSPFLTPQSFTPSNITAAPVGSGPDPNVVGALDPLRGAFADLVTQGIPQSFIDAQVNKLYDFKDLPPSAATNPAFVADYGKIITQQWAALPNKNKQDYTSYDQQAISSANSTANNQQAAQILGGLPAQQANQANRDWSTMVQPSLNALQPAANNQKTVNRAAEDAIAQLTGTYQNTITGNQNARMADIGTTNAYDTGLGNQLRDASNQTNASNLGYVNQMQGAANSANSANSALAQQFMGAIGSTNSQNAGLAQSLMGAASSTNSANSALGRQLTGAASSTNAANSALAQQLMGAASSTNSNQTGLFNTLSGQANSANAQQNQILSTFQQQMSQLNATDQQNYLKYISETNPQMAALIAQGSDPELVGNQKDVLSRWKELSTPQVTSQERLLAELARRKFESGDKSSRDAVMSQLATRGLQSGGLVIANQQATQQQLSQDRLLAELGLQSNAVQRGITGLQGYGETANTLRNADDQVRQFQDQYKQNEAVRVSNLAQQRANTGLATTGQQGQRDAGVFDAGTQTVNNNFNRTQTGIQNSQNVNQANYGNTSNAINTNVGINQSNYGNTSNATQNYQNVNQANLGNTAAGISNSQGVNSQNYDRTSGVLNTGINVNQTNLGNTGSAIGAQLGISGTNSNRYQTGLNQGDATAQNVFNSGAAVPLFKQGNANTELATAQSMVPTMTGAAQAKAGIQSGLTQSQISALTSALGLADDTATKKLLGMN